MSINNIRNSIEKNQIKWIQLHFTDVIGTLRVLHIPAKRFLEDNIWKYGIGFDGSSIGLSHIEKSDLIAIPDLASSLVLPHENEELRIIADIYEPSLKKFEGDPRIILKKALEKAKKKGFDVVSISPEMEFYLMSENSENFHEIKEKQGYFVPPPLDDAKQYRKDLSSLLSKSGYNIKYHHHETGKYQHEVEVKAMNALGAADFCMYFKYLSREVATVHDFLITFMPKPYSHDAGNGMHAHVALYNKTKNLFYDENEPYRLSQTARYFIGGILEHARGMAALANPTINSYKRLIPNFEAPIYVAWAQHNRSSLIRLPAKKDIDIEIRNADPAANPYLFYTAIINAGLDGIKKKSVYQPIEKNIYSMNKEEINKYRIERLPANLLEALEEFEKDDVIKRGIGQEAAEIFIEKKKEEWNSYMTEVTDSDYVFYFNC